MALTNTAQSVFSVTIIGATETIIMDNDDIREIYFVEDIYSYLKTGKMICRDTRGLSEFLPIVGNERIIIEYGTTYGGGESYIIKELEFVIIKVEEIENTNDKHRHFLSFFFIEEPHRNLHMAHHSRSYLCELYTDIIEHILANHVGITSFTNFEPCNEEIHYFYTGLKTPAQCVEWLGSRCSGAGSGQPGYLLYSSSQNPGAPYNFVTLETLLQQGTQMPPYAGPYTIGAHHEYNINKIIKYYNGRVDKRAIEKLMYYINLGFDIQRKRYLKNEYFYMDALSRFTCLGDFSLFEEGIDTPLSVNQELTGEFEEEFIMKNIYFGDWIKRYCLQNLATVILEGHVERYCGGMIEIMWPSANDEELFDKNMNGLFLVKSITHMFSPLQKPVYTQKMVLIKNAYNDSEGNLTSAVKVNKKVVHIERSTFDNTDVRGL
jgi:hypothetical protein